MPETVFLFDEEDPIENPIIYGIKTTQIEEYTFVYKLNKSLGMQFKRIADLDVTHNERESCHSNYHYHDEISFNDCYLIKNISHSVSRSLQPALLFEEIPEQYFLLKRFKFYDFFLKLSDNIALNPTFRLSLQQQSYIKHIELIELTPKEQRFLII